MLTLNQIVSQITNLAAAHNQIAESGVGDFAEWQAKERSYPILWVFHESTSVNQMEIAFSIRLICADRVIVGEEGDNTEGHEQEVISDTLLVLLDFLAYFQQNHSQPYNVVTSATIDPFTERLNDRLAGNSVTIQIRQPFDWNKCQIPQTGASIPPSVDGLTLYDFCDAAVLARLTNAQNACLTAAFNVPCEDVDITINSAPFGSEPSGGTFNVPVVNGGSNPVGSEQSGEWVIGNSSVFINGTQVGDIVAEDSLPIAVELDGSPSGSWNAGTQTWEVTSAPSVNATVSVTLSDSTPNTGDVIAITATPSGGFTPTNYQFLLFNGGVVLLGSQAGNVLNWTANIIGTYTLYVLATDGTTSAYGSVSVAATGDADATAYLAAVGTTDLTRRLAVNTLVSTMKTIGVWTLVDVLYIPIWANPAVNGLNVKNPLNTDAAFRQVYSGGVTHSTYGSEYNGVNGWGDTFYNPSLIAGWENNHHMGLFLNNSPVIGGGWHMGIGNTATGNPLYTLAIKRIDGSPVNGRFYDSGNFANNGRIGNTVIDARGFHLGSAIAANDRRMYSNGVNILTQTLTVIGTPPNGNINIGRTNAVPAGSLLYLQGRMALITIGQGLTVVQAQNYNTAVDSFMTTTNLKLT